MFTNLIESRPAHDWHASEAFVSLTVHAGLIALAVMVTAQAGERLAAATTSSVIFADAPKPKPPEPVKPEAAPPEAAAPPPPKGFQVLTAPVAIPDKIPDVDLSRTTTDEADFTGRGAQGGVARGVEGGTGPVIKDEPYFEFQVEKQVMPREGNPMPRYPSMLESARVVGEVLAQYVVDTLGKVEPNSVRILRSNDELFSASVRAVLPKMRYLPAEVAGHKVRTVVQVPFRFTAPAG